MHKFTALTFVVLAAFAATGCSDISSPTRPTIASTATGMETALSVRPSTLIAQPVGAFSCPALPPFTVPFQLIVDSMDPALIVTNISARFVDMSGVQMPQVTLPAPQITFLPPVPTTQFGTALSESRDVPLSLALGCATGHTGTLTLIVVTLDGQGRTGSSQLTVGVR